MIGSADIPTLIANAVFLPRYLPVNLSTLDCSRRWSLANNPLISLPSALAAAAR
jgi:hypothetical protein